MECRKRGHGASRTKQQRPHHSQPLSLAFPPPLPSLPCNQVFKSSFNRPNLRYEVVKKKKVSRSYMYGSVPHLVIGCGLPSDPPHDFE